VRADGVRTKKLIVAFHFERSAEAGWKCDTCRQAGLERKRHCGFLAAPAGQEKQIVWARKRAATDQCPVSEITAQSKDWMERYLVWKQMGGSYPDELDGRAVEAFLILEQEMAMEARHG
jgi:hypothetical protein